MLNLRKMYLSLNLINIQSRNNLIILINFYINKIIFFVKLNYVIFFNLLIFNLINIQSGSNSFKFIHLN